MALRLTGKVIWQSTAKLATRTGPALRTRLTPPLFAIACLGGEGILTTPTFRPLRTSPVVREMSLIEYEKVCKASLEDLCEYFEELLEDTADADVNLSDGVLTVKLGQGHGTYVINRQSPNRQIWLSSPLSGPKRYDYIDSRWIYKHEGLSLNTLLTKELRQILQNDQVDFTHCA